ncbi:Nuclear transcription factor Y subunit gamma [Orchesella cincta]|uniref:Nuclear transcription factor Y subunit gamma n=1 Tax=Orchesella cincta TaxID=48709 RepID=A0A1D2NFA8_ORCCI|nr:Nuclear transcription factor Y subunit gamma [Orchesella cincta]
MAQSSSSPAISTGAVTDAQQQLKDFWDNVMDGVKTLTSNDMRTQELPLARIKKIMKLDEDVKMISAEAPVLFAKAAEIFIHELTLRAWIHTEDNKRRTLQRNDIAMAITKYDQFDFLIDIVPRDELKPAKKDENKGATVIGEQVQYYLQLAQQHQQALQATGGGVQILQQGIPATSGVQTIQLLQAPQTQLVQQPQLVTTQTAQGTTVLQLQQPQYQQQQAGGIQLVQQVVGPNGEIQQIPIQLSASQLQMLRMQLQGNQIATSQPQASPIILQTSPVQQGATVMTTAQNGTQIIQS